jgi:hypothetical protein
MIRIESVEEPFKQPELVGATFGVLKRAGAMGLYDKAIPRLDFAAFRDVVRSVSRAGIGREAELFTATRSLKDFDRGELLRSIERLKDALEESPAPGFEWQRLVELFEPEPVELAELLGISLSSMRRYSSKERETPDAVAVRLHFLALLTGDLAGAYNDIGVRAWFRRRRSLLDGKAPKQLLRGDWSPDEPGPERVRALARSLATSSAT